MTQTLTMRHLIATTVVLALAMTGTTLAAAPAHAADGIQANEYWLGDYGFRAAWKTTKGKGVKVAVIDTGVSMTAPDLKGQVLKGKDFSGQGASDGRQPVGYDDPQHGTLVASLIAGTGKGMDGNGILGTAPGAKILPVSVAFNDGTATDSQVAKAIIWATDHGASIINLSLARSSPDWPASWDKAFNHAMKANVVIVASVGNLGNGSTQVAAPATMPGVLGVGGVTKGGKASTQASTKGINVAVVAPSESLVGALPNSGYALWAGTSGAAPIVSGLAALIRSAHPTASASSVINQILSTADPKGTPIPNVRYGHGAINAENALATTPAAVSSNPLGSLDDWMKMHRRSAAPMPSVLASPIPEPSVEAQAPVTTDPKWQVRSNLKSSLPVALWSGLFVSIAIWLVLLAWAGYLRRKAREPY